MDFAHNFVGNYFVIAHECRTKTKLKLELKGRGIQSYSAMRFHHHNFVSNGGKNDEETEMAWLSCYKCHH
jgi:5-methylcytosine-specific restriction endonuclease McrA